ncbi:ABC transporter permease [Bacteroidales bacterium OttesenSCG-928-K03]|nr:ABC transporter permease [Odoribacter sp. OttesenSCG-928-L07]MDL2239401.1 ABC transporter permease [Bacteroidales bacterium OttesenSCG-928-L14]MDL2240739.1 ABC transporter permease [Bacteroidales bacterium OttesenSCG-928-K22]MDL2242734.1 ABC transporter permease [Bacteroidales bacterium OttesenSCG-928-K03]
MNFPLFIGFRYLKSKKSHNVINIISWVSVVGICISTAALIVVLSVFNGLEGLITSMYSSFDPDIKITAKKGKTISSNEIDIEKIKNIPNVIAVNKIIEENVLLKSDKEQVIATIKGVNNDYFDSGRLYDNIVFGDENGIKNNQTIIGYGIAYYLNIPLNNFPQPITVMIPKRSASNLLNPMNAFNTKTVPICAVFSIQQELDDKYLFIPISLAQELLNYSDEITAIEVLLNNESEYKGIQKQIATIVGDNYDVKNHYELQETLYKVMRSEKTAVYLILSFIILIAAFNIISSLSMLIINKEKDIAILHSMGANIKTIKKIFFYESMLLSFSGAVIGLFLGFIICLIQQHFHLIKFGSGGSFIIDHYPVAMSLGDFSLVLITVLIISIITSLIPILKIKININYNRK